MGQKNMLNALGIEIIEVTGEKVIATMPVNDNTRQPFGFLHGGASVVLAETIATLGTYHLIDTDRQYAVGLEINANHVAGKQDGIVTGIGIPIHKGKSTMVWEIKIVDENEKLICASRCTVAVITQK